MFKFNTSAAMHGFACFSLAMGAAALADPISDAGLKDKDVKQAVVESFANGYAYIPGSLRTLGPEARAAFVRAAGQLAIAYSKSEAFRQDYAAWWEEHKPKLELISPQEMQEQIEQMRKQGQLPTGPQLMTEQERQQQNAQRQQEYQQHLAKFQAEHPADPREAIHRALNEFLALSASVDFNAKVVNGRFVDPVYQGKDDQWKRCFRAGKPAVDAARDVAQGWLQQV